MKKIMKQMKWDVIMTSILYVALGIVLLAMPGIMFKTLGYLIGAFLIVAGAVSMVCYLLRDAHRNYFRNDFLYGLIEITVGIIVLYKVDVIEAIVPIIFGILVVASGCRKLQDAIDLKRLEHVGWIAMLAMAAANVIFGVWLILDPVEVVIVMERLIGIGLIISGVTDCVIACYFAGIIKKYMDRLETVDTTGVEITGTDGKAGRKQPANKGGEARPEADKKRDKTGTDRKEGDKADETGSKSGSEAGSKSGDGAGSKSGSEAGSKPEDGTGSKAGIEAAAESGTESETEAGIEAAIKAEGEDKGEQQ